MTTKIKTEIKWLVRADMADVLQIENQTPIEARWTEDNMLNALRKRNTIGMVIEIGHKIVGYMIYELHKDRLVLLKLAVEKWHQGHGIGTELVVKLKSKLLQQARRFLEVTVAESDLPAQLFLNSNGFNCEEIVHNQFMAFDDDAYVKCEDALRFVYQLHLDDALYPHPWTETEDEQHHAE